MDPQPGRDAHMDAIDLTLSSPEPEARRRHQTNNHVQQQQQPARVFKPQSHRTVHNSSNIAQRQDSANVPRQQPRRIDPQHIRQLIDTSSHRALRDVVLQLCKTSPALSGALARGLTPHSPWAQGLMRAQQTKSQTQTQHTVKTEPRASHLQLAYDRMKQRLDPSSTTQSSTSQSRTHNPLTMHQNQDGLRVPPRSQKTSSVKRERRPSLTDSDDSTHIVDFPAAIEQGTQRRSSHHHMTASSSSAHAGSLAVRHRSAQFSAVDSKPNLCLRCHDYFNEEDVTCSYHTGHTVPVRTGDIPQYTCCNKFEGEPGCSLGRHISNKPDTPTGTKRPWPYNGSQ